MKLSQLGLNYHMTCHMTDYMIIKFMTLQKLIHSLCSLDINSLLIQYLRYLINILTSIESIIQFMVLTKLIFYKRDILAKSS